MDIVAQQWRQDRARCVDIQLPAVFVDRLTGNGASGLQAGVEPPCGEREAHAGTDPVAAKQLAEGLAQTVEAGT